MLLANKQISSGCYVTLLCFLVFVRSNSAYGQKENYFIDYGSTQTYGVVRNSLHYNDKNTHFRGGFSLGLGWTNKMKHHRHWHWFWNFSYNQRRFELNRLQPYSGSSAVVLLQRDTRGIEVAWGAMRKTPVSPMVIILTTGGLTQDVIGKQYQHWRDDFGNTIETQTFGVGSATFRNRAFLRAGVELKVIPRYSLVIESSLSSEIKAAFVKTIDKVNPVSFGVHFRVVKMNAN